jgi:hypothetical protein
MTNQPPEKCFLAINPPAGVWIGAEFVPTPAHRGLW